VVGVRIRSLVRTKIYCFHLRKGSAVKSLWIVEIHEAGTHSFGGYLQCKYSFVRFYSSRCQQSTSRMDSSLMMIRPIVNWRTTEDSCYEYRRWLPMERWCSLLTLESTQTRSYPFSLNYSFGYCCLAVAVVAWRPLN
jgi:hypothetical protein